MKNNRYKTLTGGQRIVPLYKEPKNSPFIPNIQKQIYGERIAENTKTNQHQNTNQSKLNPIVNLQVYQPPKPREPTKPNIPAVFYPPSVPNPYFPPQFTYQFPPYMMNMYHPSQVPVIKAYNINIDGVTGDHTKLNLIYEDMLPTKQFITSTTTLGERLNIYNFVRAMMFPQGDGKNVGLDGKSNDTILSHLKFMDLNPYNTYKLSNNPYKGLPNGFLIYKTCYPIRYDSTESTVTCAKNSIGTNIRIYRMTEASYIVNSQSQKKFNEFDEWREMSYYEYVREHIIRKKECPNFVCLYGYYISANSKIDFDKIALLRGVAINNQPLYVPNPPLFKKIIEPCYPNPNMPQVGGVSGYSTNSLRINLDAFTGKALVAMTEAPNYNLFGWASRTYQMDGNIRRQINTGFHLDKVWYSIIFQIMAAMYCMQIHKIFYSDFTVEDNIYIKDINVFGAATKYWKYKIDGCNYYIPNYGYIIMIDSNYKDLTSNTSIINCPGNKHKLYAKFLDNNNISDANFKEQTFESFKKSMDCNIYDQSFVNFGGCKPPPEIMFLLNQISTQINTDNDKGIGKYLYTFMRRFMNNRVGTYLKETEIGNIRKDEQKNFMKGQLVVYEDGSSSYKFVIYISLHSIGVANILNKNDPTNEDIIEMQVPITSLYSYTKMEPVTQNFRPNESNLNEDDLLETYIING